MAILHCRLNIRSSQSLSAVLAQIVSTYHVTPTVISHGINDTAECVGVIFNGQASDLHRLDKFLWSSRLVTLPSGTHVPRPSDFVDFPLYRFTKPVGGFHQN